MEKIKLTEITQTQKAALKWLNAREGQAKIRDFKMAFSNITLTRMFNKRLIFRGGQHEIYLTDKGRQIIAGWKNE